MRSKSYFVLFSLSIAIITNLSAQSQTSLFQNFKNKTELLDKLYRDIQQSGETAQINKMINLREMNLLKAELFSLKQEIKRSNLKQQEQIYRLNSINLADNFELLDLYMYDYSTDYYRIVARLRCKTKIYTDFVKLIYTFYQNSDSVGTDYSYIDFESYGYAGMLPYQVSFLETFWDKVNFDSISIKISYWVEDGTGDILWDQIMEIDSNRIVIGPYLNEWSGTVRNKSNYAVTFPKIFACIFKDEKMINLDYTYLDLQLPDSNKVEIYSVTTMPTDSEQVTLKNNSITSSDISGWTIGDKNNPLAYEIPQGTILTTGELKKIDHNQLGFQIDDSGEIIYLKNSEGITIDTWEDKGATTGDVRIYSVTTTPTESEQVTLKNYDINNVDISGWTIGDKNDPSAYIIPQNTILSPDELKKFTHTQLGFGINDKDEIIYLKNQAGITIDTWYGPGLNLLSTYQEKFYPNSTATFDSYIDLPSDYDKIKYYLCYSLYSLEGSGNITSNWPTFTQLKYSGQERAPIQFDMFLIDHDNDQIDVQIDWGDYSNLVWQGPFYSRSVPSLNHSYSQSGTYYIIGKSKDGTNSETNWSDSIKVEILPIPELKITKQQLKEGIYKKIYRDTLEAEGGITPYQWALSSGNLPTGLNLNSNNGEIFGIPFASGSYSFCIMVTDGGNPSVSDTSTFQIIIFNNPPQLISASSININEHEELNYTARAIDPDGNVISYNFENYPMWLIPTDSTISGIVPEGAKDTCFTVIASDGELMDTLIVNVTVTLVNDPPKIISPDSVLAIEDSVFQYIAKATDPEGDKITYIFDDYPNWLTPSDSTISGVPLEGKQDTSFIVIASDGELKDSLRVSITIIPINDPPKLISATTDTAYEDLEFTYVAKAIDPEHDEIFYFFKNYPTWLHPLDSTISGTPLEGIKDSCFTVVASDGEISDTLKVLVKVIPINDPPQIISPSNVNAYEDSLFAYTAKAIDPEHGEITYTFKNYPHWMTPSDSTISGLVRKGTIDTSFTVIATDGELMDTLVVTVKFIEKNDPPQIISPAFATAYEDCLFKYTAKAIDIQNDPISFIFKNYPAWLTAKDSTISGTPTEGIGDTSFVIIASDGNLTDTLEVIIDVIPINDPPQIIHISDFVFENNETYIINLDTCVIDEDHDVESLTWKVIPVDDNLNTSMTDHVINFKAPNWTGTAEVKFTVTDPQGASDSMIVIVTVKPPSIIENKENIIPKEFFLNQNYPNPFNPQTIIHFGIPKFSDVSITIYNLKGEMVQEIFTGKKQAGNYSIVWDAINHTSGMYLIKFRAANFLQIRKCILLK